MALLHQVLKDANAVRAFIPAEWDLLVRQARHANLLGRLHHRLDQSGALEQAPVQARNHLKSAAVMADRQHMAVRHETRHLRDTLAKLGIPLILLKGAAYVLAELPAAQGRVFADLDILVSKSSLSQIESALMLTGWAGSTQDAYDQRYYRQWMHEIPALQHIRRGSMLDVHHTILPPTSRLKPDPALLVQASVDVPGWPGVKTLSPCDMVLHSATHLFHEGESDNLLRDLSDLDLLLRHFGSQESFWSELVARGRQLTLSTPLHLALRYAKKLLGTPVPVAVCDAVGSDAPGAIGQRLLDVIYHNVLNPTHSSASNSLTPWCRRALYIRAHWLRMPPHLLAYHLGHKAIFPAKTVHLSDDANR